MSLSPFALAGLPNLTLLERLRELLARDAAVEAELLVHIGEVDARKLYAPQGYPSLYAYLTEGLHLSESVAYHRIQVARAARRFPAILERIGAGELHLSGALVLISVLTPANHGELLDRARHKSKRAIEEIVRDLAPKPDVPALVRALPAPVAPPTFEAAPPAPTVATPTSAPKVPERPCPRPEPLGNARYHVQFTAGPETRDKLREAQALLRHQIPDGDLARLFDRALDALLREARRTKFAETDRPSARADESSGSAPASRHIPAEIRRAVAGRDDERCTFVAPDGRRCASRDALEFHHREPFARMKQHRVESITLRCRTHNHYAAVQDFGADWMSRFRKPERERQSTSTVPGDSSRGSVRAGPP